MTPAAVALIAPYYPAESIGPRSVRSRRLAAGFREAGIEPLTVIAGGDPAAALAAAPGPLVGGMRRPGLDRRGRLRVRAVRGARTVVPVPDGHARWSLRHLRDPRLARRPDGVRAVYAIAPPFSSLVLGAALARRWRVPLIGDLGDPWAARSRAEARLRRWTLERVETLILTNEATASLHRSDHRVVVVPNGADELLAEDTGGSPPLLLHLGTLSGARTDHAAAFAALAELDREGLIRFRAYGETWARLAPQAVRCYRGVVGEAKARELMRGAAGLVVVGNRSALQIPSKVYEIARSNIWGLYVSGLADDPGARVLADSGHAVTTPNDPVAVRAAALEIAARVRAGERPEPTAEYSWEGTVERVVGATAEILRLPRRMTAAGRPA